MPYEEWVIGHTRVSSKPHKKAKLDDLLAFFQQLATLVSSGTPFLQALKLSSDQTQSTKLHVILDGITAKVASGSSFYAAAAEHTDIFEFSWLEVIRTGEVTGKMGQVLLELNKQIRETRETNRKVKAALTYPMILLSVAVIAVTVMLWLVVPTFAQMFKDMGAELPDITQFVVDASAFLVSYGIYCVAGTGAVFYVFRRFMRTEAGHLYVGGFLMVVPTVGELIVNLAMYRFSSNLALLTKSGVPILDTLVTIQGIYQNNPYYREAMGQVHSKVAAGRPLAVSLDDTGLFTPMLTNLVRIGEESGQLATVMEQIAPYYKEKMEGLIAKVTKMLEPVIIMGMGTTIAGLMLAIYMPMFEMAGKVK